MRDQYGIPFETIGPLINLLGRQLLPVGGILSELESGIARRAPDFHGFLTALTSEDLAPA